MSQQAGASEAEAKARPESEERSVLIDSFAAPLGAYVPIQPGAQASPVDMLFAYRLLLSRMPGVPAELNALLGWRGTWRAFLQQLLASPEFRQQLAFLPPGLRLMSEANGFRFWFDTDDREMGARMAIGTYEPAVVELLGKLVKPGFHCLDVGAQTGFFTCHMARLVGEEGSVCSFEPMPRSFSLLRRNVVENGWSDRIRLNHAACSDVRGTIRAAVASGMFVADVDGAESIESLRIDDLELDRADLCKVDVEGFEPRVIAGMRSLLARTEPILVTEVNEYWLRRAGSDSGRYCQLLRGLGYRLFDIDQGLQEVDSGAPREALSNFNALAIPGRRVKEVLAVVHGG